MKRKVIKSFYITSIIDSKRSIQSTGKKSETDPLLSGEAKKFAKVWRTHKSGRADDSENLNNKEDVENVSVRVHNVYIG